MRSKLTTKWWMAGAAIVCALTAIDAQQPRGPRFRPDDPLWIDDDRALDAGRARRDRLGAYADFVMNVFMTTGDARPIPALNVNSLGEVPDSSWFTNRIGKGTPSLDDIARGPDRIARLGVKRWTIVAGKNTG